MAHRKRRLDRGLNQPHTEKVKKNQRPTEKASVARKKTRNVFNYLWPIAHHTRRDIFEF